MFVLLVGLDPVCLLPACMSTLLSRPVLEINMLTELIIYILNYVCSYMKQLSSSEIIKLFWNKSWNGSGWLCNFAGKFPLFFSLIIIACFLLNLMAPFDYIQLTLTLFFGGWWWGFWSLIVFDRPIMPINNASISRHDKPIFRKHLSI